MKHPRRRTFPVINSLQYKFLALALVYSFIIVCFFSIATFLPDMMDMQNMDLSLEARGSAANRVLSKHTWVWPAVLSLVIILALHSFRTFLKIVGPLYRFRWAFEQLAKGNLLHRISTRKRDYLRQEEEALNQMLEVFRDRFGGLKEAGEDVFKSVDELEKSLETDSTWGEAQRDLLQAHRKHLERLAEAIHFFRLEDGES